MITDEGMREKIACEATYLANESLRQLVVPSLIVEDSQKRMEKEESNFVREGAIRNFCILGVIVCLYRLIELRDNFLVDLLFTEQELRDLGFPSIDEFLGGPDKVQSLKILRNQFAGHVTAKWATGDKPGQILSGERLGAALRELGIDQLPEFVTRLRDEVAQQLETFIGQMRHRFPVVDEYIKGGYALDVEKGRLGR